jgi:hypothetical protein
VQTLGGLAGGRRVRMEIAAGREMAVNALYAALFEPAVSEVELTELPRSHRQGPDYLNVLRFLDIPEVVAMVLDQADVRLLQAEPSAWDFPRALSSARRFSTHRLEIRPAPAGVVPAASP